MNKLRFCFFTTAFILSASNSFAGETCDTGVPGCSVSCPHGDWCIATWTEPDGPCVTRCPSASEGGSAANAYNNDETMVPVKADDTHTLESKNVPLEILNEILSKIGK